MNKVLVEISVPAAGDKFDIFIPLDIKFGDVLEMVSLAVMELTEGKFNPDKDTILCDAVTGEILDVNIEGAEQGLKNGSRLMLI